MVALVYTIQLARPLFLSLSFVCYNLDGIFYYAKCYNNRKLCDFIRYFFKCNLGGSLIFLNKTSQDVFRISHDDQSKIVAHQTKQEIDHLKNEVASIGVAAVTRPIATNISTGT